MEIRQKKDVSTLFRFHTSLNSELFSLEALYSKARNSNLEYRIFITQSMVKF